MVVFSVWQHKTFLPHDFLGEVVLSLSDATEIGRLETIDDTCGVMMPLKRPMEPRDGPFQVGPFSSSCSSHTIPLYLRKLL